MMANDIPNTKVIGLIGFGEVGQTFARGLLAHPHVILLAHDRAFGTQSGKSIENAATTLGVRVADSMQTLMARSHTIISAVTASEAETVAKSAAAFAKPHHVFLDVNSAAPSTKQRAAEAINKRGGRYVECAVMAAVLKPGLAVPMLTGGPDAAETAITMNALGMNMTPVSEQYGRASAMKLCRSIMIKGMEALMLECSAASAHHGVTEPVFASLAETFPSIDWHAQAANTRERVEVHGLRRAAEMREAAEMLRDIGLHPGLASAIADTQERGAKPKTER